MTYRELLFSGERARQFQERIAPYVHPSLDYKLHPDFRGRFGGIRIRAMLISMDEAESPDKPQGGSDEGAAQVPQAARLRRKRDRFDLQVEGNHTYLVDHVVVHNSPETQPGGRALKFYSSQRLDIRRIETLKEGTEAVGNRVRVKVVKNKVAAPFRQAEFDIEYGQGISAEGCLLDMGLEHDVVRKSGSFFSIGEERIGQGRNNAKAYLRENPEAARALEARIYEALGIEREPEAPAVESVDDGSEASAHRNGAEANTDRNGGPAIAATAPEPEERAA